MFDLIVDILGILSSKITWFIGCWKI